VLLKSYGVNRASAATLSFWVFAATLFIAGIGGVIEAKNLLWVPNREDRSVSVKSK
jgi:hypothetical protein